MFSYTFLIVALSLFIYKQECAVIKPQKQHKRVKADALELVLKKYISPLRKLTDELPNHAIEMQIEFFDQTPKPSPLLVPQRRLIGVSNRQLKKLARASDNASESVTPNPPASIEIPTSRRTRRKTTATTSIATDATTGYTLDPARKPVYMEDLNKALSDLENKLLTTTPTYSATAPSSGTPKELSKMRKGPNGRVKNINDILQLLNKAVQLEQHIPQPHNQDLDWVQIKIPKDIT